MGSPNPQDKVTGHSQYNAVHQYLISRPNKVNKHTFLYFTNLFDKHYQQSELRYWDLGRFVHGRIWGLNRLPGRDGEIGEARVSWYKLTITRPMNTPSSKYLNLARRRGNGLNPGVSEALPRETLAEGVAAKHAGNEEAEGGKDRPDCIPEYCLFAWVGQQKC